MSRCYRGPGLLSSAALGSSRLISPGVDFGGWHLDAVLALAFADLLLVLAIAKLAGNVNVPTLLQSLDEHLARLPLEFRVLTDESELTGIAYRKNRPFSESSKTRKSCYRCSSSWLFGD